MNNVENKRGTNKIMKKRLLLIFILVSLIIESLPITVTAANYKKAYRKVVNKFEKEQSGKYDKCSYNLIYMMLGSKPNFELSCSSARSRFAL